MDRPKRVCLCGSTRFVDAFVKANRDETLKGHIVLSVGMFGHREGIDMGGPLKAMLDELHLAKIDLADEVLVLNVAATCCGFCGKPTRMITDACHRCDECKKLIAEVDRIRVAYVGDSTRREIAYAEGKGKTVRYLNQPEG